MAIIQMLPDKNLFKNRFLWICSSDVVKEISPLGKDDWALSSIPCSYWKLDLNIEGVNIYN